MTVDTATRAVRNMASDTNLIARLIMRGSCLFSKVPISQLAMSTPICAGHSLKYSSPRADRDGGTAGAPAERLFRDLKEVELQVGLNVFKRCNGRASLRSLFKIALRCTLI